MSSEAKKQHFLPQFLLDGFSATGTRQVYCMDKLSGKEFRSAIKDVASGNYFYRYVDVDGEPACAEDWFHRWEDPASVLIKKILAQGSLRYLSKQERAPNASQRQIDDALGPAPDENELRRRSVEALQTRSEADSRHFLRGKVWILMQAPEDHAFLIADNPVGFQREHGAHSRSQLRELKVDATGIEVYFPLSKQYCLSVLCDSHYRQMKRQRRTLLGIVATHKRTSRYRPPAWLQHLAPTMDAIYNEAVSDLKDIENMIDSVETGVPLMSSAENVTRLNSIQVYSAERYVYSSTNDFSFVRQMLADDEQFRAGLETAEEGVLAPVFKRSE